MWNPADFLQLSVRSRSILAAALLVPAVGGCGSGSSATPDTGVLGSPDSGVRDTGASFDAPQGHDVISIFGDTGPDQPDTGVDAGRPDATLQQEGGAGGHEAGAETGAHDAHAPDAASDTGSQVKDSGGKDSSGICTAVTVPSGTNGFPECAAPVTNACGPGSTETFTATAPTTATPTNVCSMQQLQAVYDGCLGPSSSNNACTATDTGCYNCIFNGTIANPGLPWGPLVAADDMIVNLNIGGCLQLLEPCNASCADALSEDLECEQKACGTNCPITNDAGSDTAYDNCTSAIDNCYSSTTKQGCGVYSVGTTCADDITGTGHPGSVCFANPGNFEAQFLAIVPLFCSAN